MKKTLYISIVVALVIFLFDSCTKQEIAMSKDDVKTFTASIEQSITKTSLDGLTIGWDTGDEININGAVYSATPGVPNTTAIFNYVSGTAPGEGPYIAGYPASICNEKGEWSLPAVLTYQEGRLNAPMIAKSETENFQFNNICGILCVALKGSFAVGKIEIYHRTRAITGPFSVDFSTNEIELTGEAAYDNEVLTLDCGEDGAQLNTTNFTNFYFPLPPANYSEVLTDGFLITVYDNNNQAKRWWGHTEAINIERNKIYFLYKDADEEQMGG